MKKVSLFISLFFISTSVYAQGIEEKVGIGIGDDGDVKVRYFMYEDLIIKYGFYVSDRDRKGRDNYSRKYFGHSIGIRKYVIENTSYFGFVDFDYKVEDVTYSGSTSNEDVSERTYGLYGGFEYFFNEKISIDARLGFESYKREYVTYKEDGIYFPTTSISLNYLFGT